MTHTEAIERLRKMHCWGIGNECSYHFDKRGKCHTCEIKLAIEALEKHIINEADGCIGCAFVSCEEWEMPCAKCKRNCKDYWRAKA